MKNKGILLVVMIAALVFTGCQSTGPKTHTGAVAGGLLGATAGGIIGYQSGHPFQGAAIGTAVGALTGGLIGNTIEKNDSAATAVNPNYLTLTKIAEMTAQGTPDAVIINEIERTHSVYHLNSEIITYLKQNKASDKLIDYMLATEK